MTDLNQLRAIPILRVADALGIQYGKVGSGLYAMRSTENPGEFTSLHLFERTNSWYRFSGKEQNGVIGGSVIDLVIYERGGSVKEAIDYLKKI